MPRKRTPVVLPEPRYTHFEGTWGVAEVNHAALIQQRCDFFPWHVVVTIDARDVKKDGMPHAAERRMLDEAADAIETVFIASRTPNGDSNAVPLGRRSGNGMLQLRYQVHDDDLACAVLKQLEDSRKWPRPWDCILADDNWYTAWCLLSTFRRPAGL
jgi:hypothetical protein